MAGWSELRAEARATVHETFGLPASYTPAGGGPTVQISVRWHYGAVRHGDLDREGYAQVQDGTHRLLFDTLEVTPERNARATVEGVEYVLDFLHPRNGRYRMAEVVPA
jgi:hypothetical protein